MRKKLIAAIEMHKTPKGALAFVHEFYRWWLGMTAMRCFVRAFTDWRLSSMR